MTFPDQGSLLFPLVDGRASHCHARSPQYLVGSVAAFIRRSRVAVILAAGALALVPATAGAHAQVVALTPAPGVELRGPPAVVSATFSEPLNRSLSRLTLTRRGGTAVATRRIAAGPKRLVLKPLARLVRGVYGVRWHSVSAEDGHASDGSSTSASRSPSPRASAPRKPVRWLAAAGCACGGCV